MQLKDTWEVSYRSEIHRYRMPNDHPLLPTSNNPSTRPSRLGARRISPSPVTRNSTSNDDSDPDDSGLPLPTTASVGLSEKAKGKRRATGLDPAEVSNPSGSQPDSRSNTDKREEQRGRSITFRFTGEDVRSSDHEGEDESGGGALHDLDVWVDAGESVGRVKDKVRCSFFHIALLVLSHFYTIKD
jgi:hypothetical protein